MPADTPLTVGLLLFAALFGLSVSALYFLVSAPAARRARQGRLAALQHASAFDDVETRPTDPLLKRRAAGAFRLPGAAAVERRLQQAGMEMAPEAIQVLSFGAGTTGFVVGLVLGMHFAGALIIGGATAAIPLVYVEVKRSRRLARFAEQFPEAVDLLGRAVRAGHAFTTGFELIAQEMPQPLAGEFRIVYDQQRLGLSLREALDQLAVRVPSGDVMVFVSALQIQRETGGNLAEILDKLSHVIRERYKLFRQIRVFTAEGRMSQVVLTAVPFFAGIAMYTVNRDYMLPLVFEPSGRKLLLYALVSLAAGAVVIRRMTNMKV